MRPTKPAARLPFADLPLGILCDRNEQGERKIRWQSETLCPPPVPRALLKSVTDILSHEYAYLSYCYHAGVSVFRITSGVGTAIVNGRTFEIREGDLLIVNPFEAHGIYLSAPDALFSRIAVTWHPYRIFPCESGAGRFFTDLRDLSFENHIPSAHPANRELCDCIDRMAKDFESRVFGDTVSIFAELMQFYALAVRHGIRCEGNAQNAYLFDFMSRVNAYIEEHLDEDISTAELAAHCQYTTEHFCRLFKKCFDKTFKDYLNIYRIRRAKEFMDAGDFDTLAEISTKCGFNNQNHFSHMFKKYIGTLPSEYSKRKKEGV